MAGRRATPRCTEAMNIRWTFCPKSRLRPSCLTTWWTRPCRPSSKLREPEKSATARFSCPELTRPSESEPRSEGTRPCRSASGQGSRRPETRAPFFPISCSLRFVWARLKACPDGPQAALSAEWLRLRLPDMPSSGPSSALAELYAGESARVRHTFETTGDGLAAAEERSRLMDKVVTQLYRDLVSPDPAEPGNFCLVAVGGYGRQELFPYSDVDLLFLSESGRVSESFRQPVAAMARALWDLWLRVGHSARTLAECGRLHRDNLEFSISLLDCRFLAGDQDLFGRLRNEVIPELMTRHRQDLVGDLLEATRKRHEKHGSTIFHLEPNLKEAPGGLRDYHVSLWLALIRELHRSGRWVSPESQRPSPLRAPTVQAFEFLAAARCFLHYRQERDANVLTYELQDQAASLGIGHGSASARKANAPALAPADWMRAYFRHARSIDRLTAQLLDGVLPSRSSLYGLFQDWRSRLSNADFSVARGRIFPCRA